MNCDFCNNEASVFFSQYLENSLKKVSLCESCASDSELIEREGLSQVFTDTQKILSELPAPASLLETALSCECGMDVEVLSKTGRLGCSLCYETFKEVLQSRIFSMHRGNSHVGKELELPPTRENLSKKKERLEDYGLPVLMQLLELTECLILYSCTNCLLKASN